MSEINNNNDHRKGGESPKKPRFQNKGQKPKQKSPLQDYVTKTIEANVNTNLCGVSIPVSQMKPTTAFIDSKVDKSTKQIVASVHFMMTGAADDITNAVLKQTASGEGGNGDDPTAS